jgi:hypothetical protein
LWLKWGAPGISQENRCRSYKASGAQPCVDKIRTGFFSGPELQRPRRAHLAAPSVKRPSIDIAVAVNFIEHQGNMGMSITNCESDKRKRHLDTSQSMRRSAQRRSPLR